MRLARQHARVAVLTNKPVRPSERILEGLGIRDLFDDVIGGDGPFGRKPDPAGLCALMDRAGATPDRTLMVGDSAIDHETARRASVRCCLTAYGYGYETFPADRLTGDEWVVSSTSELFLAIDRFAFVVVAGRCSRLAREMGPCCYSDRRKARSAARSPADSLS